LAGCEVVLTLYDEVGELLPPMHSQARPNSRQGRRPPPMPQLRGYYAVYRGLSESTLVYQLTTITSRQPNVAGIIGFLSGSLSFFCDQRAGRTLPCEICAIFATRVYINLLLVQTFLLDVHTHSGIYGRKGAGSEWLHGIVSRCLPLFWKASKSYLSMPRAPVHQLRGKGVQDLHTFYFSLRLSSRDGVQRP